MEQLVAQCWFQSENHAPLYNGVPQKLNMDDVQALLARGRATLTPIAHPAFQQRCVSSLSVKEGTQGDTAKLPCGARSLLLDTASGEIVLRGVNKFFDAVAMASDDWITDASLWTHCRVWAARKMAGFIVTVFSLDGNDVQLISKHAAVGVHVDMARRVLDASVTAAQQHTMARTLFERHLSLSCECILREEDYGHPVLEDRRFDHQLVALALQVCDSVTELSVPVEEMTRLVGEWGLPVAPAVELHSVTELQQALQCTSLWSASLHDLGLLRAEDAASLAEGLVIHVEVRLPPPPAWSACAMTGPGAPWVRPIRLKAKTIQYSVLRSLRSLVMGEFSPSSSPSGRSHVRVYHQAMLAWSAERGTDVRTAVETRGIFALYTEFARFIDEHRRQRHRDAAGTVGAAYTELVAMTEKECAVRSRVPLTVVLLTGLPGSGKSSCAVQLLSLVRAGGSPFEFAVHLSRDVVTRDVMKREGLDEQHSSKHKLRRVRALVHKEFVHRVNDVVRYSKVTDTAGLLVLDACHASTESRTMWRQVLPTDLDGFHVVYLYCSDPATAVRRLTTRTGHATIRSADEAQQALYAIQRKYTAPPASQTALSCDTLTSPPRDIAAQLLAHLCDGRPTHAPVPVPAEPVTTSEALAQRLVDHGATVLRELLGDGASHSRGAQPDTLLRAPPAATGPRAAQVVLENATHEALLSMASHILHMGLFGAPPEPGSRLVTMLFDSVKSLLGVAARSPQRAPLAAVRLTAGHLKWLPNWLFGGDKGRRVEDLHRALRERFPPQPGKPHVTLFHPPSRTSRAARDAALARWWEQVQMEKGSRVDVQVDELLIDRLGLCFRVTLPNRREHQWQEVEEAIVDSPSTLHVTLGVASGTPPAYCGGMAGLFTEWQDANLALEQHKANKTAVRSKDKFHNFARFAFEPTSILTGVVTDTG